jgi:hypothetical protein
MAEAVDLKSIKCGFESHYTHDMKKHIIPTKMKLITKQIKEQGGDIYSFKYVLEYLTRQNEITMVEWLISNREIYTYYVLSECR